MPTKLVEALEIRDQWASDSRARLGELSSKCDTGLKVGLGAAGSGLTLTLVGALAGWSTEVVAGAAGLSGLGIILSVASRIAQDKLQNSLGKVLTYSGDISTALQRERQNLDPNALTPAELTRSVTSLLQAPRSGLLEQGGYLAMPGVRLRKR